MPALHETYALLNQVNIPKDGTCSTDLLMELGVGELVPPEHTILLLEPRKCMLNNL